MQPDHDIPVPRHECALRARSWITPCIMSPRGNPTNHHWTPEGLIGERVTRFDATHFIVVVCGFETDVVQLSN